MKAGSSTSLDNQHRHVSCLDEAFLPCAAARRSGVAGNTAATFPQRTRIGNIGAAQVKVLTALPKHSIDVIISETHLEKTTVTIATKLGLDKGADLDRYTDFCERIHRLTGGVPLLIREALEACVRCGADWGGMKPRTLELLLHPRYLPEPGKQAAVCCLH